MKLKLLNAVAVSALALSSVAAHAEGKLNIYNWGNYTNPDMVKKFEEQYDVEVTLDGYDSNETMLAKVKEGNTGYDIVVPGDYMIAVMIGEGLLAETNPNEMENFGNVDAKNMDATLDCFHDTALFTIQTDHTIHEGKAGIQEMFETFFEDAHSIFLIKSFYFYRIIQK